MKLNKNGIPVLDPPGNKMKKRKSCLPDEHHWESDREFSSTGQGYHCTICDEKDFVPDPLDANENY